MTIQIFDERNQSAEILRMPGGEWHIKNNDNKLDGKQFAFIQGSSADDMIALCIWADAVHRDGGTPILMIPYLPGARQDRRRLGEALSAKVYADIINSCKLQHVICVDPHSDVMPALINNCNIVSIKYILALANIKDGEYVGIIAPDAGANKRATEAANFLKLPVYQALKKRDPQTGKLSKFACEPLPAEGKLLVVDDICDAGGTFKGLATTTGLPPERLALWVTHGVFSDGAEELYKYFSRIYSTDSHTQSYLSRYENRFIKIYTEIPLKNFLLLISKGL